jgi:hypothetical protein
MKTAADLVALTRQKTWDAAIAAILKKAAAKKKQPRLDELLDIIQVADADWLAGVLNDDLVAFLCQILYDENLVDEQLLLALILQHIGAIDETRVEEAVSTLAQLLTKAIKDAKARHGPSKRMRVFLTLDRRSPAYLLGILGLRQETCHEWHNGATRYVGFMVYVCINPHSVAEGAGLAYHAITLWCCQEQAMSPC